MAVDYTKLFTVLGKVVDKVIDYYAYVGTMTTDQTAIETVLGAQSVGYLEGNLPSMYLGFKQNVSGWVDQLITYVSTVILDPALVTNQFAFGSSPGVQDVLVRLIQDMADNDKNVTASVGTVGTIVYTMDNADPGKVFVSTKLDAVNPPVSGSRANVAYSGLTSQMLPDAETLTLVCIADSESGGVTRGSEQFAIVGTGQASGPYSPTGENIGRPGTIAVADSQASRWAENLSFENWTGGYPDNWEIVSGITGTNLAEETAITWQLTGSALATIDDDYLVELRQELDMTRFQRGRGYFLAFRFRQLGATSGTTVSVSHGSDLLTINPTTSAGGDYQTFAGVFVIPMEIDTEVFLTISVADTSDGVMVDEMVIVPAVYVAGVAIALFDGVDKFILNDEIAIPLSNDNAGKFQTFFRKALRVQLPTDATPTISDALVA